MKAMMLTGLRRMELQEVPDPALAGDTDVLLRIAVVGVCGSDVHYYVNGRIGNQIVEYPFAVGHECSAVVEKVGRSVTRVRPGDRVAVEPAMPCWACDQCKAGRPHTCRKLRFLGCPGQASGALCEYLVMPETSCIPLGAGMDMAEAALVEPVSIGAYSVRQAGRMEGADIAILGCGPIGLSTLMVARAYGARRIYCTDRIPERVAAATRFGADWAGNPDRQDIVSEIAAREPLLLDAVLECCGKQEALDQAVDLLKPGGHLVLVGIPTIDRVSFEIDKMRRKEIVLQNIRRQNHCVEEALALIGTRRVEAGRMVTHRFPLERATEAFDLAHHYRDGVLKAMVSVS